MSNVNPDLVNFDVISFLYCMKYKYDLMRLIISENDKGTYIVEKIKMYSWNQRQE